MSISAKKIDYLGEEAIELVAGKYRAVIAPFVGSNIIRLQDTEAGIDVFRFDEKMTPEDYRNNAEVYGMPTLYLPNRLSNGVLKVSDATYNFPLNDPLGNHIHGFLHKRVHSIVDVTADDKKAVAKTEYIYDSKDEFYSIYPVDFKAEFTFTLDESGLTYEFTMTNTSTKQLPYGVCNHTAIRAPFMEGSDGLDYRLYVPVGEKYALSKACIPTGDLLPIGDGDKQYLSGSKVPVKNVIDNDVFAAVPGVYDDKEFYGATVTDVKSGKTVVYEVDREFKFWILWNDQGEKGYFCPEPSTWIIDAPNLPMTSSESGYVELNPDQSKTVKEHFSIV